MYIHNYILIYRLGVSPSLVPRYCEDVLEYILEDLTFKISEGSDQN